MRGEAEHHLGHDEGGVEPDADEEGAAERGRRMDVSGPVAVPGVGVTGMGVTGMAMTGMPVGGVVVSTVVVMIVVVIGLAIRWGLHRPGSPVAAGPLPYQASRPNGSLASAGPHPDRADRRVEA
jgi:hypothetical protein